MPPCGQRYGGGLGWRCASWSSARPRRRNGGPSGWGRAGLGARRRSGSGNSTSGDPGPFPARPARKEARSVRNEARWRAGSAGGFFHTTVPHQRVGFFTPACRTSVCFMLGGFFHTGVPHRRGSFSHPPPPCPAGGTSIRSAVYPFLDARPVRPAVPHRRDSFSQRCAGSDPPFPPSGVAWRPGGIHTGVPHQGVGFFTPACRTTA